MCSFSGGGIDFFGQGRRYLVPRWFGKLTIDKEKCTATPHIDFEDMPFYSWLENGPFEFEDIFPI